MNSEDGHVGYIILIWLSIVALCMTVGGLLFEYSFEFWTTYFKGQPVDIPFWIAMVGGVVLNGINIPVALITLLFSCVL